MIVFPAQILSVGIPGASDRLKVLARVVPGNRISLLGKKRESIVRTERKLET